MQENHFQREAFTMIELIFVIVIIGILAAVAIPKLAATRDDAKISVEVATIRQVIDNLGAEYTSQASISATSMQAADDATNCFTIKNSAGAVGAASDDGNFSVFNTPSDSDACDATIIKPAVYNLALESGIIASSTDDANTTYIVGGYKVKR